MYYDFICDCGETKTIENSINDPLPIIICPKCENKMYQDYKSKLNKNTIIVPENFKAISEMYKYDKYYGKMNVHEKQLY